MPGGGIPGIRDRGVPPGSPNLDPISDQNCFHARFQTWPLNPHPFFIPGVGRNYFIINYIRTPTKTIPFGAAHAYKAKIREYTPQGLEAGKTKGKALHWKK